MKPSNSVAIFSIAESAPSNLRQALLKRKFESQYVKTLQEAEKQLAKGKNITTVVCFGEAQDEAISLIKKLLTASVFHHMPLLVVGEEADTLKPQLKKVFSIVGALNSPTGPEAIAVEIERLCGEYLNQQLSAKNKAEADLDAKVDLAQKGSGDADPSVKIKAFTEDFFARLKTLNLLGATVGGSFYGRTSRIENYLSLLDSKGGGLSEAYEKGLLGADDWVRGHSLRVAYVTNCLLSALGQSTKEVLTCTRAALWHQISFKTNRRLARGGLIQKQEGDYRSRVAKAVRESATKVSYELRAPKESLTLGLLSRLISREEVTHGSTEAIQAYALYAADMIDRECCPGGFFDPKRGYKLLRDVKRGALQDIDPSIAVAAVKFLSEAIVGVPPKMVMPAAILREFRKRLASGEFEQVKLDGCERKVPINKLRPGMTLSRPLCTFDGKEVLESSLKLDEDLIMRVWQLTALRPIESAIILRDTVQPSE